jgi:hypothetical protein
MSHFRFQAVRFSGCFWDIPHPTKEKTTVLNQGNVRMQRESHLFLIKGTNTFLRGHFHDVHRAQACTYNYNKELFTFYLK